MADADFIMGAFEDRLQRGDPSFFATGVGDQSVCATVRDRIADVIGVHPSNLTANFGT